MIGWWRSRSGFCFSKCSTWQCLFLPCIGVVRATTKPPACTHRFGPRYLRARTICRTIYDDATNKNAGDAMTMGDITDITLTTTPNAKLLSDLTPPVTPDNTPMSIGNSPTFKTQTPFLLVHQDANKVKPVNISIRQLIGAAVCRRMTDGHCRLPNCPDTLTNNDSVCIARCRRLK